MCQSQETGAQVGGSLSAEARRRLVFVFARHVTVVKEISAWTGRIFLWRWCQQLLAECQLKAFQCLVGELLIKLSNRARECHESGVMEFQLEHSC